MKKYTTLFSMILAAVSLTACSPDFNGSRTGNDSQLIMEYTAFNTTDSQDLTVKAGDSIYYDSIVPHHVHGYQGQAAKILAVIYTPI